MVCMMKHGQYQFFKLSEFDSRDEKGERVAGSGQHMQPVFMQKLDVARAMAGIPFVITSGFRTPAHNRRVGGAINSAHMRGFAADIAVQNDEQFTKIATACFLAGFRRFGVMKNALHVDCDPQLKSPALWDYNGQGDRARVMFVRGLFAGNNIEL